MARDTWRAVLVVVAAVLLREIFAERPVAPAAPAVATQMQFQPMPSWPQPQPPAWQPVEPDRPLRRVATALTELGDSVIGVIRR